MRDLHAAEMHWIERASITFQQCLRRFVSRLIFITSGYRVPNEWLKRQGIDTARNLFHLRVGAVDIQIRGVAPLILARLGLLLGLGGVGVYSTFVHLDTGPQRTWKG